MARRDLDQKALEHFSGRVVRKDIVQDIKSGANVPTYVLEYLVGQYCATDSDAAIDEGVETVKNILKKKGVIEQFAY